MRFSGQGLMSHTSTTTISRYFNKRRGKALSALLGLGCQLQSLFYRFNNIYLIIFIVETYLAIYCFYYVIFLPFIIFTTIKNINL